MRATGGSSSLSLSLALLKENTPNSSNKQSVSGMDVENIRMHNTNLRKLDTNIPFFQNLIPEEGENIK